MQSRLIEIKPFNSSERFQKIFQSIQESTAFVNKSFVLAETVFVCSFESFRPMPAIKRIGPCTAIVEPGRLGEGDKPGVSATYRNIAAADELPTAVRFNDLALFFSSIFLNH